MAFEDSLIGNNDFDPRAATESLIRQLSDIPPGGPVDVRALNTRLARKLNQPTPAPIEEQAGPLDFSPQAAPPPPTDVTDTSLDFSSQGVPPAPTYPQGSDPMTAGDEPPGFFGSPAILDKAAVQGALGHAGGILQGAAALYDNGIPAATAAPEYDPMGNALGTQSEPQAAVPAKPLQDRTLYRAGDKLKQTAERIAPMTSEEKDTVAGHVGGGLGAIAPYALTTVLAGPLAGMGAGAVGMATDTFGHVFEDAKKHGASDEVANSAAGRSALVAGVLGSLPLGAGKYAKSLIAKIASSSAAFATAGEAQEAILQQIAKDYDPKAGYTLDQKRLIASLILGAGMGGMHHAFDDRAQPGNQPGAQPGAAPGPTPTGLPPGGPSPGAQPGAGPHPGGPGPNPGAGPQPGPGPQPNAGGPGTGNAGGGGSQRQQQPPPGGQQQGPPPGTGTGQQAGFTMDARTRAKMEKVYRHFEPGSDPSQMADHELYNAVNDHLRDTSSTGHTAKPETPDEAKAREDTARDRDETTELKGAFAWMTDAQIASMTPQMREVWLGRARGKAQAGPEAATSKPEAADTTAPENTTETTGTATAAGPDKVVLDTGQNAPESRATLKAQQDQLIKGERAAQMFPTGTREMPLPPGMQRVETERGTFHFDPKKTTAEKITEASSAGRENELLGLGSFSKADVAARAGEKPVTVVERTADGTEVRAAVGTESTAAQQVEELEKGKSPGNTVSIETAENVLEGRKSSGTREEPISAATADDVLKAKPADPTEAQAKAENYKHAHVELPQLGLTGKSNISIETGVGGVRRGTAPDGTSWEVTLEHGAYGRIKGTVGADGEPLDIFIGPHPSSPHVFVVDQHDSATGKFDEHKILAGYRTPIDALHAYANSYTDGAKDRIGHVTAMSPEEFRAWLGGDTTKALKPASAEPSKAAEAGNTLTETAAETHSVPKEPSTTEAQGESPHVPGGMSTANPAQSRGRPATNEPLSLLQFIASQGGVKPHAELNALDLSGKHRVQIPGKKGFFAVVRPGGDDLDRMREKAEEAGYLRGEHNKTSTIRDLLDGMDEEYNRGNRVAAEGDELAAPKREQQLAAEREAHDQERDEADYGDARREIADAGYADLNSDHHQLAAKIMVDEGLDADTAVERAAERLVAEDADYGVTQADFDGTYGDGEFDAAWSPPASEDGSSTSPERSERARSREGEEDRADVTSVSDFGSQSDEIEDSARLIEEALGPDADKVAPVDIARAAEMMVDNPGMDVPTAFGHAVIETAVDQGFITEQQAEEAYGPEVKDVLEAGGEVAPVSSESSEQGRAKPNKKRTSRSKKAGVVSSSGEAGGEAAERGKGAGDDTATASGTAEQPTTDGQEGADRDAAESADDADDVEYYNSPMNPPRSFEGAQLDTIEHYAKGLDIDVKGKSREQLIDALLAKGARGYQGGSIIAIPRSSKEVADILSNSNLTKPVPDVLFAKFKAALQSHPDKIEPRAHVFETEPNGNTWLWKIKGDDSHMDFTAYGDHVYIAGGAHDVKNSGRSYGSDWPLKNVQDFMKAFIAKNPLPKGTRLEKPDTGTAPEPTEKERAAERDAPTWTEILAQLPMHSDGRTRQHEIAFDIISEMTGSKKPKYADLTPAQKHELLARVKAITPARAEGGEGEKIRAPAVRIGGTIYEGIGHFEAIERAAEATGKSVDDLTDSVQDSDLDGFVTTTGRYISRHEAHLIARREGQYKEGLDPADQEATTEMLDSRTLGEPAATENGADNKPQLVMPGAEKIGQGEQAQRAADRPLKPKVAQKRADIGLFGDEKDQSDLLDFAATPAKVAKPAKDDFDDIFDSAVNEQFAPKPAMGIDDVAKGLGALFGKNGPGLAEAEPAFADDTYRQALPYFKAGVAHFNAGGADLPTMVRSLVKHLAGAGMDADAIRAMKPYIKRFTEDVTAGRETIDAPSSGDVLESDRGEPEAGDGVGKADVPAAAAAAGQGAGERGSKADAGDERPGGGERVSQSHAPAVGANGNLELPAREPDVEDRDASAGDHQRGADGGEEGFSFDDAATDEAIRNAQKDADLNARRDRQRKAEGVKVIPGDISNIADSLPMLFPEQHADVQKAEQRFAKPDGHGMLFTNGTGTGKTYSGLGAIKRMAMQGKTNTLVVAPSQGILMDWVRSAKDLGLDMRILDSIMDNGGKGLVGTTYANLGANQTLADRAWDLVVPDEAHKLSSDQNGTATAALEAFRAITKHPDGMRKRSEMVLRREWDAVERLKPPEKGATQAQQEAFAKAIREFEKKAEPLIAKWKTEARPKALMMSATPFAYHFSLDYAEGYLFEFGADNAPTGRDSFYMQHLGYRKRVGKLTKPDADVKSEVMERQLHEYLKKQGSLSGRALTVDKDYDRKFVLAHNAAGELIDRALNFLQEAEGGRYRPLHEIISKQFDYLARMRLLEAMKAQDAIPFIKDSLALGRKIVVFHDYNEGGGISPFTQLPPSQKVTSYVDGKHVEADLRDLYDDFARQNPYIKDLDFASYPAPIYTLSQAFPEAMIYNGNVPNKKRAEAKRLFNDDDSGRDIIIVQSAAGEAGISLHDTTGKRQRVLLNLGMPIRPTTSIQQEGRIYRVGQASDAMFRYMNTGTDWERWTFAGKIADRAGTAENLALGDLARTIRQSFIDAFSNAGDYRPEPGEGKGGKETDRATSESISEFDKAKTHYFANGKTSGRRDQREGTDYYATPEPVGLKMVEFAGLKPGEKILEPSAGHGAISRYFPEDSARTLVEPSSSLASRAALTSPGSRVVVDRFENLDKGANKFDAIVMNPPFGTAGKTAIDHLEKAAGHLKNGGRIVALIPRGSTDGRFDKFMDSPAAKGVYLVGDIQLPSVTFERAGTSISARIVVLEKQTDPEVAQKLQQKSRDYSDVEKIGDLFDRIENADMGQRLEPKTPDVDIPTAGGITIDGVELSLNGEAKGGVVYADLKNKLGIDKFKAVMRAAEANEGRYLKTIKSIQFPNAEARQKFLEALASPPPAPEQPKAPSGVTFKTGETIHAKTGGKLFVATANERVERDIYDQMNAAAKANGGYYSPYKGRGAIPGFQFKSAEERQKFLDAMGGGTPKGDGPGPGLASANTDMIMDRLVRDFVAPTNGAKPLGESAQQNVLARGRDTGTEHLVAYDARGHVVDNGNIEGTHNRITITPEFFKRLHDPNEDIVVHHNHPQGSSFSHDDLAIASLPGARAAWAHGHDGNIYRVEVTPAARSMLPDQWSQRSRQIEQLMDAIQHSIMAPLKKAFQEGRFTPHEGNLAFPHLVNVVLRDAGFIDYQTNFEDAAFRAKVPGLDENLAKAVGIIRKQVSDARVYDRPARPVRHPGDVGAVFDRGAVAIPVTESRRSNPQGGTGHPREAKGGPALAAPDNTFKKTGSFDNSIADILRARFLGKLGDLNATEARAQLQDKFIRIEKAEQSVGAPSPLSTHQAESLYYGRAGQRLESLDEHHIKPIIREMKGRDVKLDKLDEFMSASHAQERNNRIGAMYAPGHDFHDAMTDHSKVGGSGWSVNEALQVIRDLRTAGKLSDYLAVAKMVWALNARTRRVLYDAGLIDRDTFDAWNAAYRYYTPQRGHAEGDQWMGSPSGVNVRGKESKQAFGRRSKADSPLAYSIMQAEMAIVRAEKNRVGNTFLRFVRAHPDPARWTVDRPPLVKRVDPATGLVTSVPDSLYANRDNVFTTKINGQDVHVTLHGPDGLNLARALKNMGSANVHALIRTYSMLTHTMAKLATQFNPEFMIPNLARDLGEAFINLSAQDQSRFARNFAKHLMPAMKGSMQALAGATPPAGSSAARYVDAFHEFDAAGGRIRFFGIDDPDQIETNVGRKLKRLDGGPLNTIKDIGDKAAKAIEIAGGGLENATRLAAFMAARDAGFSTADAAAMARNLTVNFNRKGELGGPIGALYMFANAGIQGQQRMLQALGHRRVWVAVGALAAASALSTLYSILAGGDDEAGVPQYMKIPSWERDKNLIFMVGKGGYYAKVPLPYGFSPFAVIGSHAVSVAMGHEKPGKAVHAIIDSIISAFNPLGEESSWYMEMVPSALRPAFHIGFNENWTGRPLYPANPFLKGRPDSTQSFKNDSAFSKEAAKQLNKWSLGNDYKPGVLDVHPGSIDHALQAITGGVGRFLKGIGDTIYTGIKDHEWKPEKTPILRRFVGKVGEEADAAAYYEMRKAEKDREANVKQAKKDRKDGVNPEQADMFIKEASKENPQRAIITRADEQMKRLRKQESDLNNSAKPSDQKKIELDSIRQRMRKVQNDARAESSKLKQGNSGGSPAEGPRRVLIYPGSEGAPQ